MSALSSTLSAKAHMLPQASAFSAKLLLAQPLFEPTLSGATAIGSPPRLSMLSHSTPANQQKPPKWSRQMNISTTLYRTALDSTKTSLKYSRKLLNFVPTATASNVQVTELTLSRREDIVLDGMTPEQATGHIPAEWIVHGPSVDSEWKRLRGLKTSPSTNSYSTSSPTAQQEETVILYFHGGAYFMGSPSTNRNLTSLFSEHTGSRVLSVGYRLAPENPFPLPLHDAISAYLSLIDPPAGGAQQKFKPEQIVLAGDSAGGGLAIALALWIRDHGGERWRRPAGIVALAPWLDLTHSQPSFYLNTLDYVPPHVSDVSHITTTRSHYYTTNNALNSNPYVSPLFASDSAHDQSTHLPRTLIQLGSRERLRDEGLTFTSSSFKHSPIRVELYEDMVHIFQAFANKGEEVAIDAMRRIGDFVRNVRVEEEAGGSVVSHPSSRGVVFLKEEGVVDLGRWGALGIVEEARRELEYRNLKHAGIYSPEGDVKVAQSLF
ncbi:hypothetical protein HDU98_005001 [Podochytrium sp. JEL0797]|nr:hypothetical protein HDU98_005001 [Podochytrium sp. JEL0797]